MYTFDKINDATGFANGAEFQNEQQVKEYFTVSNLVEMGLLSDESPALHSAFSKLSEGAQINLNKMAEQVIANKWHCAF